MEFVKSLVCPAGKETFNGKCVKVCEPGKTRNSKTGRCNKSKTFRKPVKSVKSVKTIKSKSIPSIIRNSMNEIKYTPLCLSGRELYKGKCFKECEEGKIRNPATGRCIKGKKTSHKPLPTKQKSPPPPLPRYLHPPPPPSKNKDIGKMVYDKYKVDQEARNYLNKLVVNASASQMRKIARDYELMIPLEDYPNDDKMKDYILAEILVLAHHDARDRSKSEIVRLENVQVAIDNDPDLLAILTGKLPR